MRVVLLCNQPFNLCDVTMSSCLLVVRWSMRSMVSAAVFSVDVVHQLRPAVFSARRSRLLLFVEVEYDEDCKVDCDCGCHRGCACSFDCANVEVRASCRSDRYTRHKLCTFINVNADRMKHLKSNDRIAPYGLSQYRRSVLIAGTPQTVRLVPTVRDNDLRDSPGS